MIDTETIVQIAGLPTLVALSSWLAQHRRHLSLMGRLRAVHEQRDRANLHRLAEARQQVSLLKREIALLKSEITAQQARMSRTSLRTAENSVVLRAHTVTTQDWQQPEQANGFADTEPWERGSS